MERKDELLKQEILKLMAIREASNNRLNALTIFLVVSILGFLAIICNIH